jgi:hypothetical protein
MGVRSGAYGDLVRKPEGNIPLGRTKRKWEDNIKTDLQEAGWRWTVLIWLRIWTRDRLL